ncbi:hypothetical protein RND81_08G230500 [Saponaria officinalis]|uniref:Uncharacterized protein n=1 Tax=Saponaria officinalis TaxID=3572 RepID=A0AAW1JBJ8_SAPOF
MAVAEEPILSRVDRLDHLLRNMEEIKVGNRSPRSSSPSTPRSSEYSHSYCRSIDEAILEMEHKGSLLDRVSHLEDRLLKVCKQVEGELDVEKHERGVQAGDHKGLKQLIKSCVKGKSNGSSSPKSKSKSKSNH